MNRKIIVLLIFIGIFAVIGVTAYAFATGTFGSEATSEVSSEAVSEVSSEAVSETTSEAASEPESEIVKDPNEGVDTSVPETEAEPTPEGDVTAAYDENGDLREDSKYLDDDSDTIANYYDICPGVDDFSDECETDAYDKPEATEPQTVATSTDESDASESEYDENGALRADSKYLDDDEDTIANYYDICPGVDDFSDECETDAYN